MKYFFTKFNPRMAVSFNGAIILYDISRFSLAYFCQFQLLNNGEIQHLVFSQNGELMIGEQWENCFLFNIKTKTILELPLNKLNQQKITNYNLELSQNAEYLIRIANRKKEVVNLKTLKRIFNFQYHLFDCKFSSQISKNGEIAFMNKKQIVRFINVNHQDQNQFNPNKTKNLSFSQDGTILAQVDVLGSINFLWIKDGMLQNYLTGNNVKALCCTFCQNGKFVASGGKDKVIRFFDIKQEKEIFQINHNHQEVDFLSISPDNNFLILNPNYNLIKVVLIKSRKLLFKLKSRKKEVKSIFYSQTQILLPLLTLNQKEQKYQIQIINFKTRKSILQLNQFHQSAFQNEIHFKSYGFSKDGQYFLTYEYFGEKITIWSLQNNSIVSEIIAKDAIAIFHPDGQHIIINAKNSFTQVKQLSVLNIKTKQNVQIVNFPFYSVSTIQISQDGQILVLANNYQLHFWQLDSSFLVKECIQQRGSIKFIAFSQQSQVLISCSEDKTICFWDYKYGKKIQIEQKKSVKLMALSPSEQILAQVSEGNVISLWNVNDKKQNGQLLGQCNIICLSFSQTQNYLAVGQVDGSVCIWDYELLMFFKFMKIKDCNSQINSITFVYQNNILTGDSDGFIRLWDINEETNQKVIAKNLSQIQQIEYLPDSQLFAFIGLEKVIYIQSLNKFKKRMELYGHTQYINSIAFSSDGLMLASGSVDETIRIWSTRVGQQIKCLQGFGGSINCVIFFQHNASIAYGSEDGRVRIYSNYQDNSSTIQFKPMSVVPRIFPLLAVGSNLKRAEITSLKKKKI